MESFLRRFITDHSHADCTSDHHKEKVEAGIQNYCIVHSSIDQFTNGKVYAAPTSFFFKCKDSESLQPQHDMSWNLSLDDKYSIASCDWKTDCGLICKGSNQGFGGSALEFCVKGSMHDRSSNPKPIHSVGILSQEVPSYLTDKNAIIPATGSHELPSGSIFRQKTKEKVLSSHVNLQQSEEDFQLQLAVALRLAAGAAALDDPYSVFIKKGYSDMKAGVNKIETAAYRYWVSGHLGYNDQIEDGFYDVGGMSPYIWNMCTDSSELGQMPSLDLLRSVHPLNADFEVILVDRKQDPDLHQLEDEVIHLAYCSSEINDLASKLGKLVSIFMGGPTTAKDSLESWKSFRERMTQLLGTVVIPIGAIRAGLCSHRALLFKVMADSVGLPCRLIHGISYGYREDETMVVIKDGDDREVIVDLLCSPGQLMPPDARLTVSEALITSPLHFQHPCYGIVHKVNDSISAADRNSSRFVQAVDNTVANGVCAAPPVLQENKRNLSSEDASIIGKQAYHSRREMNADFFTEVSAARCVQVSHNWEHSLSVENSVNLDGSNPTHGYLGKPGTIAATMRPTGATIPISKSAFFNPYANLLPVAEGHVAGETSRDGTEKTDQMAREALEFEINWEDIILGERVGQGSFGNVFRADWHGSDVAVKVLLDQDIKLEALEDFKKEVALMSRLRHPNIILFMGAVTKPPNLSILTEFCVRGSLFQLIHTRIHRELDERRRIRMALDVAKGVNYLHKCNPPIIHRDLKSSNLLVDKTWIVKVCDFGLSRAKHNTYLYSKTSAGTPEWMAPEVLRNEPLDEKSDVYSFGVILWELATLQIPWSGLNPLQVIGMVGFRHQRLPIPDSINPAIAFIIESCWQSDPKLRPSFTKIMQDLRPLQRMTMAGQPSPKI